MSFKTYLAYAGITQVGFNSYWKDCDEASWISHGLASISASCKDQGLDIDLIDFRRLKGWTHFVKIIDEQKPDVIGFNMFSLDFENVMYAVDIVKYFSPTTATVVGGPHPSICPDECLDNENIDYIVQGEGEISFPKLLHQLKDGVRPPERVIQGLHPDLNTIPHEDRALFPGGEVPIAGSGLPEPFVTIIAGRGCKYACKFCMPAERMIFGKAVRRRSVDNVIGELRKLDFNSLMIHDDCFTEDTEWVKEFCRRYKAEFNGKPWVCQSRVDIICENPDLVATMRNAGLALMIIGYESGSDRVLKMLRKGCTVEQNYKATDILRENNIRIWANIMFGIPEEQIEDMAQTVKMVKYIKPEHFSPSIFTPHPGSDMWEHCRKHDLLLIDNHTKYRRSPGTGKKFVGQLYDEAEAAMNEARSYC